MVRALPTLLIPFLLLAGAAAPAGAEAAQPLEDSTLVRVGGPEAPDAEVHTDGRVRFHNEVAVPTRLIFERGDAQALSCETDGSRAVRARPGQYVLAAGAEMRCTVAEGSYRFATYTQRNGAVDEARARLRIR